MDNSDTIKNQKRMDSNTLWHWRISHAKKYLRYSEPFHYCRKIGLDFNVGSKTHKKLDSRLVTNGVILEICDFAKMLNKTKRHLITSILENNFDLGLENEQQRIDFTTHILHKVKDLMRKPPKDKHEVFTLFDTSSKLESISNSKTEHGLNMTSMMQKPDRFLVGMDDTDDNEHEDVWCSWALPEEYVSTEEMDGPHADDSNNEGESSRTHSVKELKESVPPHSFPYCEEIGLNLDVGSNQNLDLCLLTTGVMLELVHFTRLLTSYSLIILGVLEHNFEINSKNQQRKNQVWFKVSQLLERREQLISKFKNEPFCFQSSPIKRGSAQIVGSHLYQPKDIKKPKQSNKRTFATTTKVVTKRRKMEQSEQQESKTVSHPSYLPTSQIAEAEQSHLCPLDSDEGSDSEIPEYQDHLQNPTSDVAKTSASSSLVIHMPFVTTTDDSSNLPSENSNVNTPVSSQPNKRELCGNNKQTQIQRNVPNSCVMEQHEMEMDSNMWKLRANRVKQILFFLDKEYCAFAKSKAFGLEYDVGFAPKQNISVDLLNNYLLLEVANFALAMNSSQQDFLMEILEYNFDFGLQSENDRKTFACEIMNKVKQLQLSEDAIRFSRDVFEVPRPSSPANTANQNSDYVTSELSSVVRTDECVAANCPLDSHVEAKQQAVNLYPFCKEIGLKLHVNSQPHETLDINKLTNGAMTEVISFAEKLCGTFDQICLDIIAHNFDVDLQNGNSDLAKNILAEIRVVMDKKHLFNSLYVSNKVKHRFLIMGKLDLQNNPNLEASNSGCSQAPVIEQHEGNPTDIEHEDELNLWLWKLRANQIQQILSVPHGELCPLYSYSRCKKLGIDFDVGSGVKRNLDPKLLTNGIMVELNAFASALVSAQKDFITEILEYNFHLNLKNEVYRTAFAQQIISKVRKGTLKKRNGLMGLLFELPDLSSIEKFTYPKFKYCPKCYQDRNTNLGQDDLDAGHMLHPCSRGKIDAVSSKMNCTTQGPSTDPTPTSPTVVETIMNSYPRCKKTGLKLCVDKKQPKDKLDTHVLTRGIMKEMAHFTKRLCGKKCHIINDILKHNFWYCMQSQDTNPAGQFSALTKVYEGGSTWFNEIFVIQPCSHEKMGILGKIKNTSAIQKREKKEKTKRKQEKSLSTCERFTKRHSSGQPDEKLNTVFHRIDRKVAEGFQSYMCPLDSDDVLDSGDSENEDHLQNAPNCDGRSDSQSGSLDVLMPFLTHTDDSCNLLTVNSKVNPPFSSQPDKRELFENKAQTQRPRHVMKEEDIETESNMWKLRANRVKQILVLLDKEYWVITKGMKFGLEFNVGFGQKQNISVKSLNDTVLLRVASFALAMNSAQQDFIMEILEYNFDFGLQSESDRKTFACEIMNKVKQLQMSEDAIRFSRDVFEVPRPSSPANTANQNSDYVTSELSSVVRTDECVAANCPLDSHVEAKQQAVNLYPFCKEIGLKLHVNYRRPHKTLDFTKLTNGAMTEVTNFAERLCGTFDQICLDIITHNFDVDLQNVDSDLAKNILARIHAAIEKKRLLKFCGNVRQNMSMMEKLDLPNSKLEEAGNGCSQPSVIEHEGNPTDIEHEDELNLWLWKLRANQIQQILSVPHGEHCPFYSYSRCKKVGIDFNVGSGIKRNLDPKLLTNGIMVELNAFASALVSAQKDFTIEILEYNFHLDLKNELYRTAFARQTLNKVKATTFRRKKFLMKLPFELPDLTQIESACQKMKYCPKCYQNRSDVFCQNGSDPGHVLHPHADTMQGPAKDHSTKKVMKSYPHCKKIGLNLFVGDQLRNKLEIGKLTRGVMKEVAHFARRLCGKKFKIINDIIKHNFNNAVQKQGTNFAADFYRVVGQYNKGASWFNEVFVRPPCSRRHLGDLSKVKDESAIHKYERKDTIKSRQQALQIKKESTVLPGHSITVVKPKKNKRSSTVRYPICTEIGLDIDVKSKSGQKQKLDLKLLTRAVVMEIYTFVSKRPRRYFPGAFYDILDYNFDLGSQHDRSSEFALAIASKVKTTVKSYRTNPIGGDMVFKLPFVSICKSKTLKQKKGKKKRHKSFLVKPDKTPKESRWHSDVDQIETLCDDNQKALTDAWTIPMNADFGSLQGDLQIKEEEYELLSSNIKPELDFEKKDSHCEDVKSEPNTGYGDYLIAGEPARFIGYNFLTICQNPVSTVKEYSETQAVQYSTLEQQQVSDEHSMPVLCPKTDKGVKTESDTEGVNYVVPPQTPGIQEYSVKSSTIENTLVKEEQEYVPVDSYHSRVVSNTDNEMDIKQEPDP
ncbi:hypothetical protein EXN66_Car018452 [Channa argus]|uniref:Uncharacterized protein n=1 Tax=Channa argus TaxID=215402 RepID=A0A6G1QJY0_CHAAH|nr:hypothetical protein EXN66_Car018452 [Channa argus]